MPLTNIDELFIKECIDRYGHINNQLDILQEECAELIKACSKVKRLEGHWSHIDPLDNLKEEIAHVLISIEVVAKMHDISMKDINKEVLYKSKAF